MVTGHPGPRMVECDGRGAISEGLLEVVGEMEALDNPHNAEPSAADMLALQALVVQQAEALADMVPRGDLEAMRDKAEAWDEVPGFLEAILSEVMGTSHPASLVACPLESVRRFAEFVRGD